MASKIASRYFTGKPCKRGHVSERWTNNSICIECAREHRSEYRKKNPEAHRKSNKEYARRNRPEETKRQSKWYCLNKQHHAQWIREYRQQPIIKAARAAEAGKRRSQKQKACPAWVDIKSIKVEYLPRRFGSTNIRRWSSGIVLCKILFEFVINHGFSQVRAPGNTE